MPRELLEDGCSLPSPGARCPQGLCSCLHRPDDRMPIDFELSARLCERSLAATHPPRLSAGEVAACDRGCCPFELLWDHVRRNVDCANRLQRNSAAQFERFIESGESECIARALPGKDARRKWRRSHPGEPPPQPVAARCARIETGGEDFFIAATPADAERLPLPAIGHICRGRWGIEELCKVSKQLAEVEQFHARTGRGVRQELFAHSAIVATAPPCRRTSKMRWRPSPGSSRRPCSGMRGWPPKRSRILSRASPLAPARRGPDGRIRECRSAPTTASATRTANQARRRCRQHGGGAAGGAVRLLK